MKRFGSSLVLVCAVLVALPMAPCALLGSGCCRPVLAEKASPPPASASCCAAHSAATGSSQRPAQQHPGTPCQRTCCRVNVVVTSVQKFAAEQPISTPLSFVLPELSEAGGFRALCAVIVPPQSRSLQVLHCQWRC